SNCSSLTSLTIEEGSVLEHIGSCAFSAYSLKGHLVIPNTVKHIGDYAFYNTQMTFEITSDSQLTYIGEWAFADNYNGQSTIYLSSKVEYVGYYAFNNTSYSIYCEAEKRPSTWDSYWLGNGDNKPTVTWGVTRYESGQTVDGIKYIIVNDTVFIIGYVGESKDIVIPNEIEGLTVKEISNYAFSNSEIVSAVLPDTLIRINDNAFYDCDSLTSIIIPASVVEIGDCAFSNCSSLTSLTIEEGSVLEYIGNSALYSSNNLSAHLIIPNTVKYIGNCAFSYTQMSFEITSDSQLTYIGDFAFCDNWYGPSTIYLSSKVEYVGSNAFNTNNFTIYCEAESRPSTWDSNWFNSSNGTVTWGVQF
ncbi:MAG: leucine-rich repeat domain-containing protein, partial [Bacilli bacterium]|nr:leucine-rich repeat domain-containing protein [Bacilli bacterium]